MVSFQAGLSSQRKAAEQRVEERAKERHDRIALLAEEGGIAKADDPDRIASRIDRLSRYDPTIRPVDPSAIAAHNPDAMRDATAVLERVINTSDFLGVRYLEAGVVAARAVGRIDVRDANGRLIGYGTGSLVSPELLLTNHHVLPDADVAAASQIEFNYQDGLDGLPMTPVVFPLDPKRFFRTDEGLDFSLVAVRASVQELAAFSFNRLIEAEGKAIAGDFVTIVQHPEGGKKQVALRENRIVDVLEDFLHYETDTEPGSSGSPVFNDQWEVVALHHAGVPVADHAELGGWVNEGIRVSRLLRFVRAERLSAVEQALVDRIFAESRAGTTIADAPLERVAPATHGASEPQSLHITVPLEINLRAVDVGTRTVGSVQREAVSIDPDYIDREGYDPEFLGTGSLAVTLPVLPQALVPLAAINSLATSEPRYVLPYHHYSVVLNKERRLAFFTAVNIDGASSFRLKRESDRWVFDPRVPKEEQTGEEVYTNNPLDRGHLVRRLDPAWGTSEAIAKICNDDTFHFTNCSPQHHDFNEYKSLWAGLEDYVLDNADNLNFKVSVFSGPVLAEDDEAYRGVQLPRQFWKVVAMVKEGGGLSATAYLLSQEDLIKGLEIVPEAFSYGEYRTYQVPITRIEVLTGLSFGLLVNADPLGQQEAAVLPKEVDGPDALVL